VLLASLISQASVQIEANNIRDISANWWGISTEQSIPVGMSETPRTTQESDNHRARSLEEVHKNPAR
jgi:hypothetical protein